MTTFASRSLYGGAMTVDLPTNYLDVSNFRQVPDTEEVYVDKDGLTNVIVEILERVDAPEATTDEAALKYHFDDIATGDDDYTQTWLPGQASLTKMPNCSALTVLATQHPTPEVTRKEKSPDFTGIFMTLIRLPEHKTDIVVSVNVPHVPGEYDRSQVDLMAGKMGPLIQAAHEIRQKILETFEIKDFGLFVQE